MRRLAAIVVRSLLTIAVAAAAGAAAVWLTRAGLIECDQLAVGSPTLIPGWVFVAGGPALITALIGGYFALGIERVALRLAGLGMAVALAATVSYGVVLYLPPGCKP